MSPIASGVGGAEHDAAGGYALGVAITGVVFFGALDGGVDHAFALGVAQLAVVGVLVAVSALLLPRKEAGPRGLGAAGALSARQERV